MTNPTGYALRANDDAKDVALAKINGIRNSIIGCQKMNWSEHIYPLVAALEEAGIKGMEYPECRTNVGTMLDRTLAAENSVIAKDVEIARLRDALETIALNFHGSNPSLAYADAPREDYLAHVLWEARQLAKEALASEPSE